MQYAQADTLAFSVFKQLDWAKSLALVAVFSVLTALAAQVVIPLQPVPITLQTLVVLLTGALLGSRMGALAMIAYLLEGAAGLPVFQSGHGGVFYLFASPTAGYLWSYPAAAFVTGWFAERGWDRRFFTTAISMAIGSGLILLCGWGWLASFMGAASAAHVGIVPFLPGDIIKVAVAALMLPAGWRILEKFGARQM